MSIFGFLLILASIVSVVVLAVLTLLSFVKKNGKAKFYSKLIIGSVVVLFIGLMFVVSDTDTDTTASTADTSTDTTASATDGAATEMTAEEKAAAEAEAKAKAEKEAKAKAEAEAKAKAEAEEKAKKLQEKMDNAQPIEYAKLKKNADRYAGEYVKYTGEILEITESDNITMMRLAVTKKSYGYDFNDAILISYPGLTDFVEDDIVTVYGVITGNYSYTSQAGWEITIPSMIADKVE